MVLHMVFLLGILTRSNQVARWTSASRFIIRQAAEKMSRKGPDDQYCKENSQLIQAALTVQKLGCV